MKIGCAVLLVLSATGAVARTPSPGAWSERIAHAARRQGPIDIDGRVEEPAWRDAPVETGFTQTAPDEGAPASVATRFRVLWDDSALYFAVECDDPYPPTVRTSRRDRDVQADDVRIDLDTMLDGRTAYHFGVFASGQQLDGIHFNDTDFTAEWDAVWEAGVARTPSGWSLEVRIPLRVLRIPDGAREFGFNISRGITRNHENDDWQYTPPELPGKVSRFGRLVGLDGIRPVRFLELRPFVAARAIRSDPPPAPAVSPASLGPCSSGGISTSTIIVGCAGLDAAYGVSRDLRLVAALNPDFGEVEVDERVLNLTTFETFFPEKRPFFLEGTDLLLLPLSGAYQAFYSRRIGAPPPSPDIASNASVLYAPLARPIAALKLTGSAGIASVAALSAYEPEVFAQVLDPRGVFSQSIAGPRSLSALRMRAPLGDNAIAGLMGTSVIPFSGGRFAQVGVVDASAFDSERDFTADLQLAGSVLGGNVDEVRLDGTQLRAGSSGWAASARFARNGGNLIGSVNADVLTPSFSVEDLGFMDRANLVRISSSVAVLGLRKTEAWRRASLSLRGVAQRDFAGVLDRAELSLDGSMLLHSYWTLRMRTLAGLPTADDRELGDGTPLERRSRFGASIGVSSDARRPVFLDANVDARAGGLFDARRIDVDVQVAFQPTSALEARIGAFLEDASGDVRRVRGATGVPELGGDPQHSIAPESAASQTRLYLVAPQESRSLSLTLRTTAAFSPHVSLQAFGQLFAAGIRYGAPLRAVAPPGRDLIRLDRLTPASSRDAPPDIDSRQVSFALNLILRWEWRLGSTMSFVYARQFGNRVTPLDRDISFASQLGDLTSPGVSGSDTVLVKLDVLVAP